MSITVRCPNDPRHTVDMILARAEWHCPRCQKNGLLIDTETTISAVGIHDTTDAERGLWARFYGSVLVT